MLTFYNLTSRPKLPDFLRLMEGQHARVRIISECLHLMRASIDDNGAKRFEPISAENAKRYNIQAYDRFAYLVWDRGDECVKVAEWPKSIHMPLVEYQLHRNKMKMKHGRRLPFELHGRWGAEVFIKVIGNGYHRRYETMAGVNYLHKGEFERIMAAKKEIPDLREVYCI